MEKSSNPTTVQPRDNSRSARWLPMKSRTTGDEGRHFHQCIGTFEFIEVDPPPGEWWRSHRFPHDYEEVITHVPQARTAAARRSSRHSRSVPA